MYRASILHAERPRNVNSFQAAAILYGDWGTSKAYVIGLAFAVAGYSSFWLILCVSILIILVGLNYILICKYYPNGGGVYASVRHRSEVLALVGGFFLVADYIVTAALSALSAFYYLGVDHPETWAAFTIGIIGLLNFFGPRHTGNLALIIALSCVTIVLLLGALALFHLPEAAQAVQPLEGGFKTNWVNFVGVIVALSGIEAIANTTGVMRLDKGSSYAKPSVIKTSTPAVIMVMVEVAFFTALFSFVVNALPGLEIHGDQVSAPGQPEVRDSMLRYMSEVFAGNLLGPTVGKLFGVATSIAFSVLLLSAVNTAIVALDSLLFVMSDDGQLPSSFQKMNRFGVPYIPLIFATVAPIAVLIGVHDMEALAALYAVGFVGAIATNLGSTSTDFSLSLKTKERVFMFLTFLLMASIEITLFIEKDHARIFVISVMALGLLLRALVLEQKDKKHDLQLSEGFISISDSAVRSFRAKNVPDQVADVPANIFPAKIEMPPPLVTPLPEEGHIHTGPLLCAVTHVGKCLEFALREAKNSQQHLYVLFIRERRIVAQRGLLQHWVEDEQACEIFDYALEFLKEPRFTFLYDTSDNPALNIVTHAKELHVSCVILGMGRASRLVQIIRGNLANEVHRELPMDIDLIVVS